MTKKYIVFILVVSICGLLNTSCSDFLNMTPRDKKVVKTIEDHRDILASYMYLLKTPNRTQVKVMGVGEWAFPYFDVAPNISIYTGESQLTQFWNTIYDKNKRQYTEKGVRMIGWLLTEPYIWNQYYEFLGPVNMLIKDIKTAEGTDENMRNYVLGETLAWRAYSYFKLLQYYAPYKDNAYGLPMYLDPSEDIGTAMPERHTQKAVFKEILNDCNQVLDLLKKTPANEWTFAYREDFIHAMMASIYTWKAMSAAAEPDDWKMAKMHADQAIGSRKLAASTEELKNNFDCSEEGINIPRQSAEFYVRIVESSTVGIMSQRKAYALDIYGMFEGLATGIAEKRFVDMYSENDRRKSFYLKSEENGTFKNDKYNVLGYQSWQSDKAGCFMPFRLAEMYLIKAEAACRMGDAATGAETLRAFKSSRYTSTQNVPAGADDVLKEVLMERKREFYLENDMIWLDMKRLGERLERTINGSTMVLEPNDFRYTFPIPQKEMERNKKMVQNPGWENVLFMN